MPVRIKVHLREISRGVLELAGQPFAICTEVLLQTKLDFCEVFVIDRPRSKWPRAAPRARVRHVENIAQPGRVTAVIYKRDALCPSPHIPPHALRPHVVFCTRARVRPLRVDKHLVSKVVFVVAGHRGKQRRPLVVAVRDSAERVMCKRGGTGYLIWRRFSSLRAKIMEQPEGCSLTCELIQPNFQFSIPERAQTRAHCWLLASAPRPSHDQL